jgi:hypothetical protein
VFTCGLALFSVASLTCGLSGSAALLVAARAAQGLGAALVTPAALSILTGAYSEGEGRSLAVGFWTAAQWRLGLDLRRLPRPVPGLGMGVLRHGPRGDTRRAARPTAAREHRPLGAPEARRGGRNDRHCGARAPGLRLHAGGGSGSCLSEHPRFFRAVGGSFRGLRLDRGQGQAPASAPGHLPLARPRGLGSRRPRVPGHHQRAAAPLHPLPAGGRGPSAGRGGVHVRALQPRGGRGFLFGLAAHWWDGSQDQRLLRPVRYRRRGITPRKTCS